MSSSQAAPVPFSYIYIAKLASTATCGLILGSTTWASIAVMPSIIRAPLSTHSKLSVFDGLIDRANKTLPPVFLIGGSALGYLAYYTSGESRRNYRVATLAMVASLALQTVIVPKNNKMQAIVRKGKGKEDDGGEGNRRIGELLRLNWVRVGLAGVAFSIALVELANPFSHSALIR